LLCADQRGFKTIIQQEAGFLTSDQKRLGSTVQNISYSDNGGVSVSLASGDVLDADYALVTFSLGVLQNDDVTFDPALPAWKKEAIQSMTMVAFQSFLFSYIMLRC
jgi:polyamine oxidase